MKGSCLLVKTIQWNEQKKNTFTTFNVLFFCELDLPDIETKNIYIPEGHKITFHSVVVVIITTIDLNIVAHLIAIAAHAIAQNL